MKEIIEIFKSDLKRIFKSKIATLILLGIAIIPGIYAWLNIDSNWNPYDNTGNIKIAVVNEDSGVKLLGKDVNMGDLLVENLKANSAMKWTFVDAETAKQNTESGEYYGAIILPENFSQKITTLFDGAEISKPQFDFYVNNKKNPIAPIIVNKAVGTLETTLDQAFVNAVVYKTVTEAEDLDVTDRGAESINNITLRLNTAKENIEQFRITLNTITAASNSTASALTAVKDLLPTLKNYSSNAATDVQEAANTASSFGEVYVKISDNINSVFSAAESLSGGVKDLLESVSVSDAKFNETVDRATKILDSLSDVLEEQERIISSLQTIVHSDLLDTLKTRTVQAKQKINDLETLLFNLKTGGAAFLDQAKTKARELDEQLVQMTEQYNNVVGPVVESALKKSAETLTNFVNVSTMVNSAFSRSEVALSHTIDALNSTNGFTANIDLLLKNIEADIDKIIKTLGKAGESELYLHIVNLLQNSPEEVADFISKPIATNQIDLYPIDSYGAKMSPFYTTLATWVGCTLLVSILKTDTLDKKKIKNYQAFFGRFMLFGSIAVLQGLIIGIGDIVLGVQVINLPLFLITIMASSLVFMMIVYALTISFGKIGEAAAVVLMVIQVAGSGGTFPIELLPDFFQKLQPFMPFYPAMGALRETIGGFYQNSYLLYMLLLLCHTILPLILGLVLRRPIISLKRRLSREVEETEVII